MYQFKQYYSQQGIALLIVLIFMQIFALLGLYFLSESLLLQKINSDDWVYLINQTATHETQEPGGNINLIV